MMFYPVYCYIVITGIVAQISNYRYRLVLYCHYTATILSHAANVLPPYCHIHSYHHAANVLPPYYYISSLSLLYYIH